MGRVRSLAGLESIATAGGVPGEAISVVGATTATATSTTALSLSLPAGTTEGDLLLAIIFGGTVNININPPAALPLAWKGVFAQNVYGATMNVLANRVQASPPASYAFTTSTTNQRLGFLVALRGDISGIQFDDAVYDTVAATQNFVTMPSIRTTRPGLLLLPTYVAANLAPPAVDGMSLVLSSAATSPRIALYAQSNIPTDELLQKTVNWVSTAQKTAVGLLVS